MPSSRVLTEEILSLLQERGQTFALAESCTLGLLTAAFSYKAGLSKFFIGGVTSYANSAKQSLLDVSSQSLENFGAVSEEVAIEMAKGVAAKLNSHWALSVSGIAGPSGGTKDKPVGTVCFAVLGPKFVKAFTRHFSGNREAVQKQSIDFVLRQFLQELKTV
tara:strand:- start:609 stop:1094 length:486 start_codon:yes stop_codon:yes gene_type:complete